MIYNYQETYVSKKKKIDFRGVYLKLSLAINRLFNWFLAMILIICSLPIFIIISIIIKLQNGGPVFYKGIRLGLDKKPFTMYKFRTLIPDAEKVVGAEVLAARHKVMTPYGKLLRDTRLDELPQLFNILKGDMDFVGPRPLRPEIYEKYCKHIKAYDKRFSFKPGLIGYAQLFTPHSAMKRIQSMIDNRYLKIKQKYIFDMFIIFFTLFIVIRLLLLILARYIWNQLLKSKMFRMYKENRASERVKAKGARVYIGSRTGDTEKFTDIAKLIDINEEAFLVYAHSKIEQDNLLFKLEIVHETYKRRKKKTALCVGSLYRESKINHNQFKYAYVIKYMPISPLNHYMVHQYFLFESMV